MKKGPRKIRRDSTLKLPPEEGGLTQTQRDMVAGWLAEDGEESCRQRLFSELHIASPLDPAKPISAATLYDALAYWRAGKRFNKFESLARAQAQHEAEAKGGMSAEEMDEAVDRNFIMLAAETEDTLLYKELRMLRITDQSAKTKGRHDQIKLEQKARQLAQKDQEITLGERRVKLLEEKEAKTREALGDGTLSLEERQSRIKEIFGVQ